MFQLLVLGTKSWIKFLVSFQVELKGYLSGIFSVVQFCNFIDKVKTTFVE